MMRILGQCTSDLLSKLRSQRNTGVRKLCPVISLNGEFVSTAAEFRLVVCTGSSVALAQVMHEVIKMRIEKWARAPTWLIAALRRRTAESNLFGQFHYTINQQSNQRVNRNLQRGENGTIQERALNGSYEQTREPL